MSMNFNRASLSIEPVNVAINDAIERAAAAKAELPRPYLGASIVGDGCLRKVQSGGANPRCRPECATSSSVATISKTWRAST